jgi:hypothetical protein
VEVTISLEELRKRKLMVAVPMYGGQCAGIFAKSCVDLSAAAARLQLDIRFYYIFNESLITRARNYCADEFLRSDCTHLMFIDSDIGFNADDVVTMLTFMSDESPYDVLCGPYPKKTISWEKIKLAVDKGIADNDPNVLSNFVGDYVFNPVNGTGVIPLNGEPAEIMEAGTGFMMIKRKVFEKIASEYPQYSYKPDHVRTAHFDGSREITMFFQADIDPFGETKRYLSEDYWFCQLARKSGHQVWLCPWMSLQHVGSYIFGGSLAALASVGASATVDPTQLKSKG